MANNTAMGWTIGILVVLLVIVIVIYVLDKKGILKFSKKAEQYSSRELANKMNTIN